MVESRTTVLTPGTVEDRNKHTVNTPEMDEMEQFTSGDAKFGVMSETRAFFTAWIFLTRLPAPMGGSCYHGACYIVKYTHYAVLIYSDLPPKYQPPNKQ